MAKNRVGRDQQGVSACHFSSLLAAELINTSTNTIMSDKPVTVFPIQDAAGGYLARHEIIALHLAMAVGRAEFYPSCT